jgi:hypothetical protein
MKMKCKRARRPELVHFGRLRLDLRDARNDAEAAALLLPFERRPGEAVDDDRGAEELGGPGLGEVACAAASRVGCERDLQLGRAKTLEEGPAFA